MECYTVLLLDFWDRSIMWEINLSKDVYVAHIDPKTKADCGGGGIKHYLPKAQGFSVKMWK